MERLKRLEIEKLVNNNAGKVNGGRSLEDLIMGGKIPELKECNMQRGKVSDSIFGEKLTTKEGIPIRLMFRTNRISTHDINRGSIPFKDQVLALNHDFMLKLVRGTLGTAQFNIPGLESTSTVIASENVKIIMLENVIRAYMAQSSTSTSLYQSYKNGKREFCGHKLPEGLKANGKLPYLMDTPSTKEKNDQSVTPSYLFKNNICTPDEYTQIRNSSLGAFGIISEFLRNKNLILVDTKTEHGINSKGEIVSADELYTLDSSRFWKTDEFGNIERDEKGNPISFSKEFARGMIKDEKTQMFTDEQRKEIAIRYIEGYQHLTGQRFIPDLRPREQRIIESVDLILRYLT